MSAKQRGEFIVLYGPNNLGKTTQAKILVDSLIALGINAQYLKYPIYDLPPTGPIINGVLRHGVPMSSEELQRIFAQNRRDYEPRLRMDLENGVWKIAEDYTGTGFAWGMTHGVSFAALDEMNKGLLREDLAILLDGERFTSGIERGHRHEDGADWALNRRIHLGLMVKYGWELVNANQTEQQVHREIMSRVASEFLTKEVVLPKEKK